MTTQESVIAEEAELLARKRRAIAADDLELALHCKHGLSALRTRYPHWLRGATL